MKKKEKFAVGVDLGGTNIKIGIVTEEGKIVKQDKIETKAQEGPKSVIAQIKKAISKILKDENKKIKGIGIGSPGVVSTKEGTVEYPPNFPKWKKVNLGQEIKEEFNLNVQVENDANTAAIGEMIFGNGKNINSFIMITLGTGVGGGIIFDRKLFRGEFGAAGEIGHTTIDYKGLKCNCQSFGCIETFLGNRHIINRFKRELPGYPDSLIWGIINGNVDLLTPKHIDEALEKKDKFAKSFINEMGYHLGSALASAANLLDISTFIIGGGVAGFGKPLLDAADKTIRARVLTPLRKRVRVLPAKLKNNAGIKGASALVFYKIDRF